MELLKYRVFYNTFRAMVSKVYISDTAKTSQMSFPPLPFPLLTSRYFSSFIFCTFEGSKNHHFRPFFVPFRSILLLLPLSTPPPLKTKRGHNTLCITLILASFHLPLHIKCKFTMLSYLHCILRYLQERIVQSRNIYNIPLAVTYNLEVHCAPFAMQCEIQVQLVFRHTFSVHVFVRTSCV